MIYVESIKAKPKKITIKKGEWYYGTKATIMPIDATEKNVTWSSNDLSIASVNYLLGYIYAKDIGKTKVYVTAIDGSGKTDYITVTVI